MPLKERAWSCDGHDRRAFFFFSSLSTLNLDPECSPRFGVSVSNRKDGTETEEYRSLQFVQFFFVCFPISENEGKSKNNILFFFSLPSKQPRQPRRRRSSPLLLRGYCRRYCLRIILLYLLARSKSYLNEGVRERREPEQHAGERRRGRRERRELRPRPRRGCRRRRQQQRRRRRERERPRGRTASASADSSFRRGRRRRRQTCLHREQVRVIEGPVGIRLPPGSDRVEVGKSGQPRESAGRVEGDRAGVEGRDVEVDQRSCF